MSTILIDANRSRRNGTRVLRQCLLWTALLIIPAAIVVAGFEWYTRSQIVAHYQEGAQMIIKNQPLTTTPDIDGFFGRKPVMVSNGMFKVNETFLTAIIRAGDVMLETAARSNNLGFLSDRNYVPERDPDNPEFRIVITGDSMTGTTVATRQWVDYLEDLLNASGRHLVGGRTFRTYNLGWNGAGFPHFYKAYDSKGRQFDPDLVIVNYIESDYPRTYQPERPRRLTDRAEMVEQAHGYMEKFLNEETDVLFTLMPLSFELTGKPDYGKSEDVRRMLSQPDRIVVMREATLAAAGITEQAIANGETDSWYNLPYDGHMSDEGGDIYARAMALRIMRHLAEKAGSPAIDEAAVRATLRSVPTPPGIDLDKEGMRILSRPDYLTGLQREIARETLKGRLDFWHLYTVDRIRERTVKIFSPDLTGRSVVGANVPVRYGDAEKDFAILNIACASKPYSLSNPECRHSFVIFAQ